jgi:hypothetical protein
MHGHVTPEEWHTFFCSKVCKVTWLQRNDTHSSAQRYARSCDSRGMTHILLLSGMHGHVTTDERHTLFRLRAIHGHLTPEEWHTFSFSKVCTVMWLQRNGAHCTFRVETKIFVFVFSRKFCENLFSLFAKKSLRKVTKITKIFAKTFAKNENVWENGRRKGEILWNILRCQIKSENSTAHHALQNCQIRMVL